MESVDKSVVDLALEKEIAHNDSENSTCRSVLRGQVQTQMGISSTEMGHLLAMGTVGCQ